MRLIHLEQAEQDRFVGSQNLSQFLQSWQWSAFQADLSNKVYRLGVKDDQELVASASLIVKQTASFKYLYSPRGPIIKNGVDQTKVLNWLIKAIKELAKKDKAKFWRWEPTWALPVNDWSLQKTIDLQPPHTLILDLHQSEAELLKAMHQKTRYNLRLAEKKHIAVAVMKDQEWSEVWQLFKQTKARDGFSLHEQKYYQAMLQQPMFHCLVAKHQEEIIAANIICHYGDTATYVHGASANIHRETMASYLLQWRAITQAKAQGLAYYDFFGIDAKKWPGVTRFKQGWGGQPVSYIGTWDLIFSPIYYTLYKQLRKIRRLI
ncbi:MAG: peptidoglycan bridge formation glycyltransferase FemA/FemB family protein [bacterium]